MSDCGFVVYLQDCSDVTWLVPCETAAVSARSVYTIQPCTMSRHFMQSHIRYVHACLAVNCHLHFCQNGQYLLRAAAVIRGWNGYRNVNDDNVNSLGSKPDDADNDSSQQPRIEAR